MRLLVVGVFVADLVSIAVPKQGSLDVTVDKPNCRETRTEKPASPQGGITEIGVFRLDPVKIDSIRRRSEKTAPHDSRTRKYRRDDRGILKAAIGYRRGIGNETDDRTIGEAAIGEGGSRESNPLEGGTAEIDIRKPATGTIQVSERVSGADLVRQKHRRIE